MNDLTMKELSVIDDALHSRIQHYQAAYAASHDDPFIVELRSVQIKVQSCLAKHYKKIFNEHDSKVLRSLRRSQIRRANGQH